MQLSRYCLTRIPKIDMSRGATSKYLPRFRPRRLVMPVNPDDVHSSRRQGNPLYQKAKAMKRLERRAERRGAVHLADVPSERSVADLFRVLLDSCCADPSRSSSSPHMDRLKELLEEHSEERRRHDNAEQDSSRTRPLQLSTPSSAVAVKRSDQMWEMLERTPLSSPVHGALALRGKAIVESTLLTTLQCSYPRLRSKHAQHFLHECCGLLPCGQIAKRLGLTSFANVDAEVGMWRELNVLTARVIEARRRCSQHRERAEKGVTHHRRWYWRAVLKSASGRLKLFPIEKEDIQPRMEWIRDLLFAFVAFFQATQNSRETSGEVRRLVLSLFAPALHRSVGDRELLRRADELLHALKDDKHGRPTGVLAAVTHELRRVVSLTGEERQMDGGTHPMNMAADRRRHQLESSGAAHSVEALRDDLVEDHHEKHADLAPPSVVHCTGVANALKEAQLIIRYAPLVLPEIRNAGGINVEQVIRRRVEVHETNPYASLRTGVQQFRQVSYTVCRLYSGKLCLGEGKGESLTEAIQMAAQDMVTSYYLRVSSNELEDPNSIARPAPAGGLWKSLAVDAPTVEEELHF